MHGSINVPCREPIRWKPWERSEPYVSLPACDGPNIGRRGFALCTGKYKHSQTSTQRHTQEHICTNHHLPVLLRWITFPSCSSHLFVFALWGLLKMSSTLKNAKHPTLQSWVIRLWSEWKLFLNSVSFTLQCIFLLFTCCNKQLEWLRTQSRTKMQGRPAFCASGGLFTWSILWVTVSSCHGVFRAFSKTPHNLPSLTTKIC